MFFRRGYNTTPAAVDGIVSIIVAVSTLIAVCVNIGFMVRRDKKYKERERQLYDSKTLMQMFQDHKAFFALEKCYIEYVMELRKALNENKPAEEKLSEAHKGIKDAFRTAAAEKCKIKIQYSKGKVDSFIQYFSSKAQSLSELSAVTTN